VNQDCCEPRGAHRFRLPVTMAQDAAAIAWIDLDYFSDGGESKAGPRQEVPYDGLDVAIGEPARRLEGSKPQRISGLVPDGRVFVLDVWTHGASKIAERLKTFAIGGFGAESEGRRVLPSLPFTDNL